MFKTIKGFNNYIINATVNNVLKGYNPCFAL